MDPAPAHEGAFELWVAEGQPPAERRWRHAGDRFSIGSHPTNELVLGDGAVSRFHCEVRCDGDAVLIADLGSRNGTFVDGVRVKEAYLSRGAVVRLGRVPIRFGAQPVRRAAVLSESPSFGGLVGDSAAMRAVFALLERAAGASSTVLLEGPTGTGKGEAALALHDAGARRGRPFVVVDCGAIPQNLVESELFGHERGAFTGADAARAGAFETAHGGTIFLDEIGELPLAVQPRLLRALEERQVRRIGSQAMRPVDVRVIAATNRDLRSAVNDGSFRTDLFYRLAVVRIRLPALRDRLEDLPVLCARLLDGLGATAEQAAAMQTRDFVSGLRRSPWDGNVRELRNYLERCLVLEQQPPPREADEGFGPDPAALPRFQDARGRALSQFERRYLELLLEKHDGKVAVAAEAAGLSRVYLYRLLARYGLGR
jgi:DNA-binding NtrC family response regulator